MAVLDAAVFLGVTVCMALTIENWVVLLTTVSFDLAILWLLMTKLTNYFEIALKISYGG